MSYVRILILPAILIYISSSCLANKDNYPSLQSAKQAKSIDEAISILDAAQIKLLDSYNSSHNIEDQLALANIHYSKGKLYISTLKIGADTEQEAKTRKAFKDAISLFGRIEKEADQKCRIEEKRLGSRYARKTPLWKSLKEILLRAKLNSAWCNFYLSKLTLEDESKKFLNTAIQEFNFFHKNGFSIQPIILNSYIGSASCWLEANKPRLALKDLDYNEITPLNIDLDVFRQIALIRSQAYDKISSSIGVEDNAKQYFDMFDGLVLTNSLELDLAKLRLKHLAKLSTDTDSNPYYKTHLRRFYEFTSELYLNGILQDNILDISREYNIKPPCYYYKHCIELINNNDSGAIEAINAFLEDRGSKDSPFAKELHQKLIILLFNEKQYSACFNSFWTYVDKFNIDDNDKLISKAAFESAVVLLENKHYELSEDVEKLIKLLALHNLLDNDNITIARAKVLIAKNMYRKTISLLDDETFKATNIDRAMLLKTIAYFKLSLDNHEDEQKINYLKKAQEALAKISLSDTNMSPNEREQTKRLIVLVAKSCIEKSPRDYQEAKKTLEMLGDNKNREALLIEVLIESRDGNIDSIANKLNKLIINGKPSKFEFELLAEISDSIENTIVYDGWQIDNKSKQANLVLLSIYKTMLGGDKDAISQNNRTILLNKLANAYYYAGEIDNAHKIFNKLNSLSLLDTTTNNLYNLADTLERSKQSSSAIKYWKLLSRKLPKFSDRWYEINERLINAWASCGQNELARKYLEYFLTKYEGQIPVKWQQRFKGIL